MSTMEIAREPFSLPVSSNHVTGENLVLSATLLLSPTKSQC